jgi:DNA-binding SARP family transcriptional activator
VAHLHIQLLGGLRVRTAAGREVRLPSRKATALLACLALQPGAVHRRDFLAALLWDDSDPELARSSLRQALASLRRALPADAAAAIVGDAATLALDAALVTCDVQECRARLRDGSLDAIETAIECHSTTLLEGFQARSAAFEQWLEERRRELRRELLQAIERAASRHLAAGDLPGATQLLERLVLLEPANERAQRELMECLARLGRHTDALRQYRACVEALRRDLDVAPEPATEALHRDILKRRRGTATTGPADEPVTDRPEPSPPTRADAMTLREAVVLVARLDARAAAQHQDPEATQAVRAAVEQRIGHTVARFGGVADPAGLDEVVAVFGLGALTGNEAERAVRAALELVASSSAGHSGPRLAAGVARGLVLPAGPERPFPLAGSPSPQAQALARATSPGTVVVSTDVALQVSDRFELEPVTADPHGSQTVRRARESQEWPQAARLVGRRPELAMLAAFLDRTISARRGRAVVVRGEPGIGKSSLLAAFGAQARASGATVHVVSVLDFGQAAADRPTPALAAKLLGLPTGASAEQRRSSIERAVADGWLPTGDAVAAADLLGLPPLPDAVAVLSAMDDAARDRARARLLHRLLERAASRQPQLVVIEDAHWAEPVEVGDLADVAAASSSLPVLTAISTRADGDPISAAWRARARGCPVTALDLAPLADDEARDLAAQHGEVPAELVEQCLATAGGHPFFLEQLLRAAGSGQVALPGSVRALLLARVERLPADARRILQAAAVLGQRFELEALRHVLGDPTCSVERSEHEGLLACDGSECTFSHALIRTVVGESLLRSTRRDLHLRASLWFEGRDPAMYAHHLAGAEAPGAAAAYLAAAAREQAACRFDRAEQFVGRARELATDGRDQCAASAMLGEIKLGQGRTEDAVAALRVAIDLAASNAERARAWLGLATSFRVMDRYEDALDALRHAEQAALAEADPRQLAHLWTLRGNLHFPRGEIDECLAAHERALEFAKQAGSPEDIARALGGLGDAQYQRGRMRTAHAHFRSCVDLCVQHGLTSLRLSYLPMLAVTLAYAGDFVGAIEIATEAAGTARRLGDLRAELLASSIRGSLEVYRARYAVALECSTRSVELARELGARRFEAEALALSGLAHNGLQRQEDARAVLHDAVELARTAAPTYCGPWALGAMAMATDQPLARRRLLDEGEALLACGCVSHNHLEFRLLATEVSLRAGDRDGALHHAQALEVYTSQEPLPWADLVIARARACTAGDRAAVLETARRMQFEMLVPALLQPAAS